MRGGQLYSTKRRTSRLQYCRNKMTNTQEEMNRVLDLGVDGIFTNRPDVLRALVEERATVRSA